MIPISSIHPDIELRDYLAGKISVGSGASAKPVTVYGDWEKPTNELPADFIVVYTNGDIGGVGMRADYAEGALMVSLYCKLNDDGSIKKNRIGKILAQFESLVQGRTTKNYYYAYNSPRFITPTSPYQSTGYSITTLNLAWHTTNNFNK